MCIGVLIGPAAVERWQKSHSPLPIQRRNQITSGLGRKIYFLAGQKFSHPVNDTLDLSHCLSPVRTLLLLRLRVTTNARPPTPTSPTGMHTPHSASRVRSFDHRPHARCTERKIDGARPSRSLCFSMTADERAAAEELQTPQRQGRHHDAHQRRTKPETATMMMMERTSEILESKIKTTASSVAFPARFSVAAAGPTKESSMPAGGRAKFHVTGPRRLAIGAARLANGHAEIRRRAIGPTCLLSYAARARGGAASPLVSSLGTGHDVCRPERNVPILLLEPGERASEVRARSVGAFCGRGWVHGFTQPQSMDSDPILAYHTPGHGFYSIHRRLTRASCLLEAAESRWRAGWAATETPSVDGTYRRKTWSSKILEGLPSCLRLRVS